jgi:hypothetical protein
MYSYQYSWWQVPNISLSWLNFYCLLCSLFLYLHICFPYLIGFFNACVLWLLVVLEPSVAIYIIVSHMYYDIVEGFVSCTAVLVRMFRLIC